MSPSRQPGPITQVGCWAHARRNFFELADLRQAPLAIEAATRIDAIFAFESDAMGPLPEARSALRTTHSAPRVKGLEAWLRENRAKLSAKAPTEGAINYLLKRWAAFTRFLGDGQICFTNSAAERAARHLGGPPQLDLRRLRCLGDERPLTIP